MKVSIEQSDLDKLASLIDQTNTGLSDACLYMSRAFHEKNTSILPEAVQKTRRRAEAAESALRRLVALGAKRPGGKVANDTLPLHLLDTPETRELLSALEKASDIAAKVDLQRGWVDADGEPTGWGETLAGMVYALRQEVEGPKGKE
jgi:hypothetical protein